MSTLTALKPRPYIFSRSVAEIELVQAYPEDLKVYNVLLEKEVLRKGLVFWLKSTITGKIEQTPRTINDFSNPKELKEWIDLGHDLDC